MNVLKKIFKKKGDAENDSFFSEQCGPAPDFPEAPLASLPVAVTTIGRAKDSKALPVAVATAIPVARAMPLPVTIKADVEDVPQPEGGPIKTFDPFEEDMPAYAPCLQDPAGARQGLAAAPPGMGETQEDDSTLMIRNLPNDYSRQDLLELLNEKGFRAQYDFVYLPRDVNRKAGKGYAFVNFVTHDAALRCKTDLQGFSDWSKKGSSKICEVTWGDKQGRAWAIEKYRNHWTNNDDADDRVKPVLFKNGVRVQFPKPTKRMRAPPNSAEDKDRGLEVPDRETMAPKPTGSDDLGFNSMVASILSDSPELRSQEPAHLPINGSFPTPSFGNDPCGQQPAMDSFGGPDGYFDVRDQQLSAYDGYDGVYPGMAPPPMPLSMMMGMVGQMPMPPPMGYGGYPCPGMDPHLMGCGGGVLPSADDLELMAKRLKDLAAQRRQAEAAAMVPAYSSSSSKKQSATSRARLATSDDEAGMPSGIDNMPSELATTVMFRNIPNDYSRDDLLELIDAHNFGGLYDFFYLPMDFGRVAGKGYAFVNLITHEEALRFMDEFNSFTAWKNGSKKAAKLEWGEAAQQGLDANKRKYQDSPLMHPDVPERFKPLLFENGVKVDFPKPSKVLKRPRHFQAIDGKA